MLLFFTFLWLSSVSLITANSGISQKTQERIIGGQEKEIDEAPWQVSLQYDGSHSCGGSIYSSSIIITAAHCVYGREVGRLSIRAGSSKHNSGGTLVKVGAMKYHNIYNSKTLQNDVAVLKLSSHLAFNRNIQSIPLAKREPATGSRALSTGWGLTLLSRPEHLRGIDTRIRSKLWCKLKYPFIMHDDDICAGFFGEAVCKGDSGGPLVVNGELVGIVSKGGTFLCLGSGLYASVAYHREWILQAIYTL